MSKILITTLGVGPLLNSEQSNGVREYRKATYFFYNEDTKERDKEEASFIGLVLAKKLKVDKIFLIGTAKSMWEEVYKQFLLKIGENPNKSPYYEEIIEIGDKSDKSSYKQEFISENDLKNVNSIMDKYLKQINSRAKGGSECIIIKYGISENELLENVKKFISLADDLNNNDEIYIDITHSFRSIPIFMFLMIQLINALYQEKNITIKDIYYGMLDAKREFNNEAPIIKLTLLNNLLQWINGMHNFFYLGNGYIITDILKKSSQRDKIKNKFKLISDLFNFNQIKPEIIKELISHIKRYTPSENVNSQILSYFKEYFIRHLEKLNLTAYLDNKPYLIELEFAKWNFDKHKYNNAYLGLNESLITFITHSYIRYNKEIKEKYKEPYNKDLRKAIPPILDKLIDSLKNKIDININDLNYIVKIFRKVRNNIAHPKPTGTSDNELEKYKKSFLTFYKILNNIFTDEVSEIIGKEKKILLEILEKKSN